MEIHLTYSAKQLKKAYFRIFDNQRFRDPWGSIRDPYRYHPWRKLWSVIAHQMPGLEHLTLVPEESWSNAVMAVGCWPEPCDVQKRELSLTADIDQEWVRPLLALHGLKSFTLELDAQSADAAFLERLAVLEEKLRSQICCGDGRKGRDLDGRISSQVREPCRWEPRGVRPCGGCFDKYVDTIGS